MSKKEAAKTSKSGAADENLVTRAMLHLHYTKACKAIGVNVHPVINDMIRGSGDEGELISLVVEGEEVALGPSNVHALTMALVTGPYTFLRSIRIWKQHVGNEGAIAIATLLKNGTPNVAFLELLDCDIGSEGCKALGSVLKTQKQPGLLTLNLNYNRLIQDEGVAELCDGLFSNSALKHLRLDYCRISEGGSLKLAQLLIMPQSALQTLSLQGNCIGNEGLYTLSSGLVRCKGLITLNLADNSIRNDRKAIQAFAEALEKCVSLTTVDLTYNSIGMDGAEILIPVVQELSRLQYFLVDSSLPPDVFSQLNRAPKAEGKKKKGGKKKGKKK